MKRDLRVGPDGGVLLLNMSTERCIPTEELTRYKRRKREYIVEDLTEALRERGALA